MTVTDRLDWKRVFTLSIIIIEKIEDKPLSHTPELRMNYLTGSSAVSFVLPVLPMAIYSVFCLIMHGMLPKGE